MDAGEKRAKSIKWIKVKEKTWKEVERRKSQGERFTSVNYFDRVREKGDGKIWWRGDTRINVYFDCETFEYYSDPTSDDEPLIVPYAIGVCTDEPGSYKCFLGVDSTYDFCEWLFTTYKNKPVRLLAFNLDYDFRAIRPVLAEKYKGEVEIYYEMTDAQKLIFGRFRSPVGKRGINIDFKDLWMWDRGQSLRSSISNICDLTFNEDGSMKKYTKKNEAGEEIELKDIFAPKLYPYITSWGFNKDSFQKTSIDYLKVNFHQVGDDWYYYTSKEDLINKTNAKKFDEEEEMHYLKVDVTSLPIVNKSHALLREMMMKELGIKRKMSEEEAPITLPGFGKWLCEEFENKYMTETYRCGVPVDVYDAMADSYTGAFVCGNSNVPYLDEEVFKQWYPDRDFYDEKGEPIIKSYDVNSMYPAAMSTGLPVGEIYNYYPGGECVCWYEVHFKSAIDPHNPDPQQCIYKWKPQYAHLNNTFFGSNFNETIKPGSRGTNKIFVWDKLYDLFREMCDSDCEVVMKRYQRVSHELYKFVDKLYTIKRNDDGRYTKSIVAITKLVLNSLYGKMGEKFKDWKIVYSQSPDQLILKNKHLFTLDEVDLLSEEFMKTTEFKREVAPFLDWTNQCGFIFLKNEKKRFNDDGEETRESITAGIYITSWSRHYLLSTIKNETDQGNIVLYCDTDSVKMIQLYPPKFACHNKNLGAWKNEGSFTHFGHPHKHKKYFMHNMHKTKEKEAWMVKAAGVNNRYLRGADKKYHLEMIKTIYDPNNRVLVKNCRPDNKINDWYQIVIRKTHYKFAYELVKEPPTHILEDGVLRKYEE